MRINYHSKYESGIYEGEIPKTLYKFINQLANTVDFSIKPILRKEIISDIQEWAVEIVDETDKQYKLYYNYAGIKAEYKNFSSLMNFFPHFVSLEEGEFDDELKGIQDFRENEFKRNLKYD